MCNCPNNCHARHSLVCSACADQHKNDAELKEAFRQINRERALRNMGFSPSQIREAMA